MWKTNWKTIVLAATTAAAIGTAIYMAVKKSRIAKELRAARPEQAPTSGN